MIPRYSRKEMSSIWSDKTRYSIWLEVETLALEGMAKVGLVPQEIAAEVREKGAFDVKRIQEIEAEVKHDVIAFLTNVAEHVGPSSRYVHRGMTSNDLLDTTFAVQLKRSGELILKGLDEVTEAVKARAEEYRHTPCIGRTHGIHAEPITFGLKLISWYAELRRARKRIEAAIEEVSCGKISGAVGTYASLPPAVEAYVMEKLGLKPETVATQVVSRDRHAAFFSALAILAASIERFSTEIRHLQRTEVREAEEEFTRGQKGSSAMPHKRNPILTENLCGLSRIVRNYAAVALQNVPLWHERDISHSSAERIMAPDACIATDFMLHRFKSVISGLVVYPERMKENIELTRGLIFSGTLLVRMVDKGITREDAYKMVQKHALAAWAGGEDFPSRIRSDADISGLFSEAELNEIFDLKRHFAQVDMIFKRALDS
ncbi:MAG: adenylosuccinate lyase [Candidatus Dadabacteria bacterium]|nr:MAG: adenylosuccinate lyase [Candidatus Dadabacteria bacterium]